MFLYQFFRCVFYNLLTKKPRLRSLRSIKYKVTTGRKKSQQKKIPIRHVGVSIQPSLYNKREVPS